MLQRQSRQGFCGMFQDRVPKSASNFFPCCLLYQFVLFIGPLHKPLSHRDGQHFKRQATFKHMLFLRVLWNVCATYLPRGNCAEGRRGRVAC